MSHPLDEWVESAQQALDRDGQSDWDITKDAAEVIATQLWNHVVAGVLPLPGAGSSDLTRYIPQRDKAGYLDAKRAGTVPIEQFDEWKAQVLSGSSDPGNSTSPERTPSASTEDRAQEPLATAHLYNYCDCVPGHRCDCWDYPGSSDPETVGLDVGALRSVVEQAARMGSCSQTHHEWIAKAAVAALTEAKPETPA